MDLLEAIRTRRSIYHFSDRAPDESHIRVALDHAICAPNHHRTNPWRFVVISGEARRQLAEAFVAAATRLDRSVSRAVSRAYEAPVMVVVGMSPQTDKTNVLEEEELLAVGAATQNFILALHAQGIATIWTTGALVGSREVAAFAGFDGEHDRVVGLIHVGFADQAKIKKKPHRKSHEEFTRWINELGPDDENLFKETS